MLNGKKTYIIAALMVIVAGLKAQGYITDMTYDWVMGLLAGGGFAALRSGTKHDTGAP